MGGFRTRKRRRAGGRSFEAVQRAFIGLSRLSAAQEGDYPAKRQLFD